MWIFSILRLFADNVTNQRKYTRRKVLLGSVGLAITALAGCSTSDGNNSGNPENGDNGETTDAPSTETQATDTQTTETTTEAGPQFSTDGDDSEQIDRSSAELNITQDDIPLDGYSLEEQSTAEGSYASESSRTFRPDDSTRLEAQVEVYDDVSEAQTRYSQVGYDSLGLGEPPDTTKELDIAVASKFESGRYDGGAASVLKIRDANVYGQLVWLGESQEPLELQVMGEIAVAMHQKWR